MLSLIIVVPFDLVNAAITIDWQSVGNPGYGMVLIIFTLFNRFGETILRLFLSPDNLQPISGIAFAAKAPHFTVQK